MGELIPNRTSEELTGSKFYLDNIDQNTSQVEAAALKEFLEGNIPNFLRKFIPIEVTSKGDKITYLVMPDVLSLGTDEDYLRMPLDPISAKKIADLYNCVLPTKKMADDIFKNATNKLQPHPKGPPYGTPMLLLSTFVWHNNQIQNQLKDLDFTKITTGHKKDVVIDKEMLSAKDRVSIYGWFYPNGKMIQGPVVNTHTHESSYRDYSHGIRLIAQDVIVNDQFMNIYDVLNDKHLCHLISEDGAYDAKSIYLTYK